MAVDCRILGKYTYLTAAVSRGISVFQMPLEIQTIAEITE